MVLKLYPEFFSRSVCLYMAEGGTDFAKAPIKPWGAYILGEYNFLGGDAFSRAEKMAALPRRSGLG